MRNVAAELALRSNYINIFLHKENRCNFKDKYVSHIFLMRAWHWQYVSTFEIENKF